MGDTSNNSDLILYNLPSRFFHSLYVTTNQATFKIIKCQPIYHKLEYKVMSTYLSQT